MFKNKLAELFRANAKNSTALRVAMGDDGSASVYVYDAIGWFGIEAADFVQEINAISAETIHLRIDSPGGDVFAARAMKTALEQHKARVVAHVDGLAASAASFLMLGADEIEISDGAFVMIHNAWTIAIGDRHEMAKEVEVLGKIDGAIAQDYARRGARSAEEFAALMDAETWLDAAEAEEIGLVDRIYEPESKPENRFDLSVYENAPAALSKTRAPDDFATHRAHMARRLEMYERLAH